MDGNPFSLTLRELYGRVGTAAASTVIDVRADPAFAAADAWMVAEVRRSREAANVRASEIPSGRRAGVYSVGGEDVKRRPGGKSGTVGAMRFSRSVHSYFEKITRIGTGTRGGDDET